MIVDDGGLAKVVITQLSPVHVVHDVLNVIVVLGLEAHLFQLLRDLVLEEAVVAPRDLELVAQQVELSPLRAASADCADVESDQGGLAYAMQHETGKDSVLALAADHLTLNLRNGEAVELEVVVEVVEAVAVVEDVERNGVVPGDVIRVHRAGHSERLHGFAEGRDGAVGRVVGESPVLLQRLPRGPDPVRLGVVQEEDGVVGGETERRHGIHLVPAD